MHLNTEFRIATAPSSQATCKECGDKIIKGTKRLEIEEPTRYNNNRISCLCSRCAPKFLYTVQSDLRKLEKAFAA